MRLPRWRLQQKLGPRISSCTDARLCTVAELCFLCCCCCCRGAWQALQLSRDPAVLCALVTCLPGLISTLGPSATVHELLPSLAGLLQAHLTWIAGQLVAVMAELLELLPPSSQDVLLKVRAARFWGVAMQHCSREAQSRDVYSSSCRSYCSGIGHVMRHCNNGRQTAAQPCCMPSLSRRLQTMR